MYSLVVCELGFNLTLNVSTAVYPVLSLFGDTVESWLSDHQNSVLYSDSEMSQWSSGKISRKCIAVLSPSKFP